MTKEKTYELISQSEMEQLLYELSKTQMYQAMLKYNRARDAFIISSLATSDPFKDPTKVARDQGVRMGLYDIEGAIVQIVEKKEAVDENAE